MGPRVIVQNEDTGCEHGGHFGESLDAKRLAETFCSMPLDPLGHCVAITPLLS